MRDLSIGLFLDMDRTLTYDPINLIIAGNLGCAEEFMRIEIDWERSDKTTMFNDRMIPLFDGFGFNKTKMDELFPRVPIRPGVERLLQLPVAKHIISSGPSYYIFPFAEKFGVLRENVICSVYDFDDKERLVSGHGIDGVEKSRRMVELRRKTHYDLTVGVGDNPKQDLFLEFCDFRFVISNEVDDPRFRILNESLEPVIALIERILA